MDTLTADELRLEHLGKHLRVETPAGQVIEGKLAGYRHEASADVYFASGEPYRYHVECVLEFRDGITAAVSAASSVEVL